MSNDPVQRVPGRAWVVTFAGTAVNLCLGILYAWSVWKKNLANKDLAGTSMSGINEGWTYLTDSQATVAYAICGITFALVMIIGGKLQDRHGPRIGAVAGGLCLAVGCIVAGLMKSYLGLVLGFGILGGIGMGLGYAASTPAAVKWFGPHQRGLIVGLVVGGYGGAAIYISPLAEHLIGAYGISGSFIALGVLFALVVIIAGSMLSWPPADYRPPQPPAGKAAKASLTAHNWNASQMIKTWQFYALVFLFIGSAQSGLLVIANAAALLKDTAGQGSFWVANAWILSSFGGFVNATGRVGTGMYSDFVGRTNTYTTNGILAVICLLAMPTIMHSQNVALLFIAVAVATWQYGGGLSLMPAMTADFFGAKNLGFNYGLVFIGWGIAFFVPQIAGIIKDRTGSLDYAFYLSAGLLTAAIVLSRLVHRPLAEAEKS